MSELPRAVDRVLRASAADRDEAWGAFVAEFTPLLLHVARCMSRDADEKMDAYAEILQRLATADFKRLRGYAADPRSKFTTWLVVVARRICVDRHRTRFGRARESGPRALQLQRTRRNVEVLAGDSPDVASIADGSEPADETLERAETQARLRQAILALAPADRLLLELRFTDNRSAAEIARALKFPSQFHVYRRVNGLLAELRAQFPDAFTRSNKPEPRRKSAINVR